MEVVSSPPDLLPALLIAKTSELSLLVKSLFGGGATDAGIAAPTSASVCRLCRNELWAGLDTNTH